MSKQKGGSQSQCKTAGTCDIDCSRYLAYVGHLSDSIRAIGGANCWSFGLILNRILGLIPIIPITYVFMDSLCTASKCTTESPFIKLSEFNRSKFADRFIWHTFASFALPTVALNGIRSGIERSWYILPRHIMPRSKFRLYSSVIIGVLTIPMVIGPVDALADHIMDNSYRKCPIADSSSSKKK